MLIAGSREDDCLSRTSHSRLIVYVVVSMESPFPFADAKEMDGCTFKVLFLLANFLVYPACRVTLAPV